ncbi:KUP/HAK/KT family potassium transporter [Sphingobacterium daejeonense]|uniref:KUP/HAK/KT family potassium transporter n=1 Tax=Sphingobacterium daejeonense TaxID=371142 RepID=UPI0035CD2CCE
MWAWFQGRRIRNRYTKFVNIDEYLPIITKVSADTSIPKYASQLVYLTSANFADEIEESIVYSIIQKHPKRADVYWLVHVDVTDEPYTLEYKITSHIPGKLIRVEFHLGFRIEQGISSLFRMVVENLVKTGEVDINSTYASLKEYRLPGDFRFVVIEKVLSNTYYLDFWSKSFTIYHSFLKRLSLSDAKSFGLDLSFVTVEKVPLFVKAPVHYRLTRIPQR